MYGRLACGSAIGAAMLTADILIPPVGVPAPGPRHIWNPCGAMPPRLLIVAVAVAALGSPAAHAASGPVTAPLHREGAWLVDGQGRVFIGHGANVVRKSAPYYPFRFGEADARLLADEGFTVARIGFIWEAFEPQPGKYDDAYVKRIADLDNLLGRYGIRTLIDFHQDLWSRQTGGDGAPAWATLGPTADSAFAAFWRDDKAPDGVGIQTHFVNAWHHAAEALKGHTNVLGLDPFNEPYPGTDYPPPCGDFSPCAQFESGALADFYRRVTATVRSAGAKQVIYPEGIADSGVAPPALPRFDDPQTAFTFHFYCNITQGDPREANVGDASPEAAACAPIEQWNIANFLEYAKGIGVPSLLGEFSCNDVNPDNAQIVDQLGRAFTSWTIWACYTAADDPADCPGQGLLADDTKPASQANVKQPKLDALVVPYPQAIAGTPKDYAFDRSTKEMTLSYGAAPVPGVTLGRGARTQVFVPARQYPHGYKADVTGGKVVSAPGSPWLEVMAAAGASSVSVKVTPLTGGAIQRPLDSGALPVSGGRTPRQCSDTRLLRIRLRGVPRSLVKSVTVFVNGERVGRLRGPRRAVRVPVAGLKRRGVHVRVVVRTIHGRTLTFRRTLPRCSR
jgi:endoglycosylceramidase